jgi:archaellum component FlaC
MVLHLFFLLIFHVSALCPDSSLKSFIVKNKPEQIQSKNSLKEDIGDELETLHSSCTALSKEIAKIQFALAESEENLVKQGKALINNQPPFKKANKEELSTFKQKTKALTKKVETLSIMLKKSELDSLAQETLQTPALIKR